MRTGGLEPASGTIPDGIVPLIGYREWAISRVGDLRLRSLFHPTVWPADRPLAAVCLRPLIWHVRTGTGHAAVPDVLCECGIYAFRGPGFDTLRGAKGPKVRGVVHGWGRYVLGTSGWRAEFARAVAVLEDPEDPTACREIDRRYGIPVFPSIADAVAPLRRPRSPDRRIDGGVLAPSGG